MERRWLSNPVLFFLVTFLWAGGSFAALSTGLQLDGNGSYATAGGSAGLNVGSGDFTLSAWIKRAPVSSASDVTIVGKNLAGTYGGHYPGFRIRHDSSGRLLFQVADSQDRFVLWGNAKIPANEWHHVSAIRAGTDLFIYIDGELDAVAIGAVSASSNLDTSHPFAVGASVYWSSTRYFTGNVDDVTLHSRALTPLELFEQMSTGPDGDDPSLLASYTFEASITTDDSGRGHDLSLIGGAAPGKGTSGSRHTIGAHFNGSSAVRCQLGL